MRIIDLTYGIPESAATTYSVALRVGAQPYTGVCYKIAMDGMSGTYLDFPGHIAEFDDGHDAANYPLEKLVGLETTVIHLHVPPTRHGVTAADLDAAGVAVRGEMLIIHALGERSWGDFDPLEISWFAPSGIDWICRQKPRVFLSDIYEKRPDQQGIFVELFRRGILTVCCPANLHHLRATYSRGSILPLRIPRVTQVPCRCFVVEA